MKVDTVAPNDCINANIRHLSYVFIFSKPYTLSTYKKKRNCLHLRKANLHYLISAYISTRHVQQITER